MDLKSVTVSWVPQWPASFNLFLFTFDKAVQNQDEPPGATKTAAFGARGFILNGQNRHHLFILSYLLMDKESVILDICGLFFFFVFFLWPKTQADAEHHSASLLTAVQHSAVLNVAVVLSTSSLNR